MKKITFILVFSLLFAAGVQGQKMRTFMRMTIALEYFKGGLTNEAIALTQKTLKKTEKRPGKDSPDYMFVSNILNGFYLQTNKINEVGKTCLGNYKICEKAKDEYPNNFIMATQILATYYQKEGNIWAADTILRKALKQPLGEYERASTLSMLGFIAIKKGDLLDAEYYYLEVINIFENASQNWNLDYATALNNLAMVYAGLGLREKSIKYCLKAIDFIQKTDNKFLQPQVYANAITNLAINYIEENKFSQAEKLLTENIDNIPKSAQAHTFYVLGGLYLSKKRYVLAKQCFDFVVSSYTSKTKDEIYYTTLNALAVIEVGLKQYDKAEEKMLANLSFLEKRYGQDNLFYARNIGMLAVLYEEKKDYPKATSYFLQDIEKTKIFLQKNILFLTENEKFKFVQETNFTAEHFQNFVLKTHSQNPAITADLFNFLLLRKKIILQNTIKTKQIIENSANEQIKADYQKLLELKYRIADQNTHPDTVKILDQKIEKLQKDISLQIYEQYPNNSSLNLVDFNKIKSELADNEVVVEFTNFNNDNKDTTYYCALVAKKHSEYPELIYLCTEKELQNALAKENPHTITAAHVKNIYEKDNKLYKYLFEKIEPHLKGISTVNISPAGLVHNVAFACLKDSNNVYLKDKYQIKYYVSFANLINEKDCFITQNNTNNIALFGDMKYDLNETQIQDIKTENTTRSMDMAFLFDKNKIGLQPLPATKSEVDSIETIFSKKHISCKKYTGTNAIEENFYELDNSQTEVLHIATHGYYFPDNQSATDFNIPMLNTNKIDNSYFKSGLFFSGATNSLNNDQSMTNLADGILSAYEICNLNLSKVKLVVLSACLTGVGDIQQNEGVIGLSRAFKIAGADNLIISLWEVPSQQTAEFMIYFYKNITSGLSIDKAFAKAQKKMSEKYYTNPYYWGGFILLR